MEVGVFGDSNQSLNWLTRLRSLPILLFALFGGSSLFLVNPGLFWDDWVWVHKSGAEHVRIGQELGVWWAGYLSSFIFELHNPVVSMRILAFVAWLVAALAFVYSLMLRRIVDFVEAVFIVALLASVPLAMIRFLVSLAMYNVYIACFWIGMAILAKRGLWGPSAFLAAAFFLFSFHLNSLLLPFVLFFVAMFLREQFRYASLGRSLMRPRFSFARVSPIGVRDKIVAFLRAALLFAKRNALFVALPFVFILVVRLPSMLIVRSENIKSIYSDYNSLSGANIIDAVWTSVTYLLTFLSGFFTLGAALSSTFKISLMVCIALVMILPFISLGAVATFERLRKQTIIGIVLFLSSIMPYLLVGKPPQLGSFYDERNIMPALPGLALLAVALVTAAARLLMGSSVYGARVRNLALAILVGLGVSGQFNLGVDFGRDWMRQVAIINDLHLHKNELEKFDTIIIRDASHDSRIQERHIWAYEYTGMAVSAFGKKDKLMVPLAEYAGWAADVAMLHDPYYRTRYNLQDFDNKAPAVVMRLQSANGMIEESSIIDGLTNYWRGSFTGAEAAPWFGVKYYLPVAESESRIAFLRQEVELLQEFNRRTGHYPFTTLSPPRSLFDDEPPLASAMLDGSTIPTTTNGISSNEKSDFCKVGPYAQTNRDYGCYRSLPANCISAQCAFFYMSDGVDFKLIFVGSSDFYYGRQAFPEHSDPTIDALGFWTDGARNWVATPTPKQ